MAFDASRQPQPEHRRAPAFEEEPIDWVDWGMRIAVFGPLLALYLYWLWTIVLTAIRAFS
jgi:hypothetical protein